MKEYAFEELGYFKKSACEKIKEKMQGKTYMNFDVNYSNYARNCTLTIKTDYEAEPKEIKNFFLYCALNSFSHTAALGVQASQLPFINKFKEDAKRGKNERK